MGLIRVCSFSLLILFCTISLGHGAWQQVPKAIVKGLFGSGPGQFGFATGYAKDEVPNVYAVLKNGNILIVDAVNDNSKLFDQEGSLLSTFEDLGLVIREASGNSVYAFKWNEKVEGNNDEFLGVFDLNTGTWAWIDNEHGFDTFESIIVKRDDNLIIWNGRGFKYTPTGELLATYDKKPLELGVIESERKTLDGQYQKVIAYEDATLYH